MSNAGSSRIAVARSQTFFCYQCNLVVDLIPSPNSNPICPNCNGSFLQEYNQFPPINPNPNSAGTICTCGFQFPFRANQDYYHNQLLDRFADHNYGTPASKKAVEELPKGKVTEEIMKSDCRKCAVCLEDFVLDSEVKLMPCGHLYHSDCLLPWLKGHNTCPVCRYKLPIHDRDYKLATDDSDSENSAQGSQTSTQETDYENMMYDVD